MFKKATKQQLKLRMAIIGASGSGKTFTSCKIAQELGSKVAVIDTEKGSASKYADLFDFDVCELDDYSVNSYIEAIDYASREYDVLVIDSLSHAWTGSGGILDVVDNYAKKNRGGNTYMAWKEGTPLYNKLIETILSAKCHIIATMRAKTEYVQEEYTDGSGRKKTRPIKVGLAPIMRDGLEYEFDIVGDMDFENNLIVTKTRCHSLSNKTFRQPGKEFANKILDWLNTGERPKEEPQAKSKAGDNWKEVAMEWALKKGIPPEQVQQVIDSSDDVDLVRSTLANLVPPQKQREPDYSDL